LCYNDVVINITSRFDIRTNGQNVKIYELVYGEKTNQNYVLNHLDDNPNNNKLCNLELVTNWFNSSIQKKSSGLDIGINYNRDNRVGSYQTKIAMPRVNGKRITFGSQSIDYLQNLHFQFGVKSGLVSSERYLQEVPNWLPDLTIQFKPEHQIKLELLIEAHIENQLTWDKPIRLA
jgi:hypothetical protein